jgi:hypothetical protein
MLSTVHKYAKKMHRRKRRRGMTSAECSTAVTLHAAGNAPGNSLPTFSVSKSTNNSSSEQWRANRHKSCLSIK